MKGLVQVVAPLIVYLLLTATTCVVQGFAPPTPIRVVGRSITSSPPLVVTTTTPQPPHYRSTTTALADSATDGSDRGNVLLGLSFIMCVWLFTIPPEFRRAHFCTSPFCEENRSICYDCVTFGEWAKAVENYYQSGGGISFDFTVAQETKDLWAGK